MKNNLFKRTKKFCRDMGLGSLKIGHHWKAFENLFYEIKILEFFNPLFLFLSP